MLLRALSSQVNNKMVEGKRNRGTKRNKERMKTVHEEVAILRTERD
jgi:hypothetical protein